MLEITSSALGVLPTVVVPGLAFGSYLSLWFGSTVTLTVVVVVEPSGKVVLTTPVRLPVESVSGLVIHSCLVLSGKLVGLPSGVWATTIDSGSTWLPLGTITLSLGATLYLSLSPVT